MCLFLSVYFYSYIEIIENRAWLAFAKKKKPNSIYLYPGHEGKPDYSKLLGGMEPKFSLWLYQRKVALSRVKRVRKNLFKTSAIGRKERLKTTPLKQKARFLTLKWANGKIQEDLRSREGSAWIAGAEHMARSRVCRG